MILQRGLHMNLSNTDRLCCFCMAAWVLKESDAVVLALLQRKLNFLQWRCKPVALSPLSSLRDFMGGQHIWVLWPMQL